MHKYEFFVRNKETKILTFSLNIFPYIIRSPALMLQRKIICIHAVVMKGYVKYKIKNKFV